MNITDEFRRARMIVEAENKYVHMGGRAKLKNTQNDSSSSSYVQNREITIRG